MTLPVLFVSHGAATLTMDPTDPTHRWMVAFGEIVRSWQPSAVLVCSGHDVRPTFTFGGARRVPMLMDHPAGAGMTWEAPGSQDLAKSARDHVRAAGIRAEFGAPRLDHGAWVPLKLLFPAGDVPVVTVSLAAEADAAAHLALGRALAPVLEQGVLLLASGGATHDQATFRRRYFAGLDPRGTEPFSTRFDGWLESILTGDPMRRDSALATASTHNDYVRAHPTPDHFLPLLVASGAAGTRIGARLHTGFQHALSMAAYRFG